MSNPSSRSPRLLGIVIAFCILSILLVVLWPGGSVDKKIRRDARAATNSTDKSTATADASRLRKRAPFTKPLREGDPKGPFFHVFDKAQNADRFLLSKNGYKNLLPESDAPAGMDLQLQNEDGSERLVAENVVRAKFSPDGNKIAYTTADAVMHIEGTDGSKIGEVPRAYDPDWRADSQQVVFSQGPEGQPANLPGTLKITTYDLGTGEMKDLTHGGSDDVRPHYAPSGCIVFVNGGRSGLASFWKICGDGEPEQITNMNLPGVNEKFVPTPYMRSGWSPDKHWFVYDFKQGEREETWGMEFDSKGNVVQTKKIGVGIDPRFKSDGRLTALKHDGEKVTAVEYALP